MYFIVILFYVTQSIFYLCLQNKRNSPSLIHCNDEDEDEYHNKNQDGDNNFDNNDANDKDNNNSTDDDNDKDELPKNIMITRMLLKLF